MKRIGRATAVMSVSALALTGLTGLAVVATPAQAADSVTTKQFGGTTGTGPAGIAVDKAGNVFTANNGGNSVTKISADGTSTAQFGGTVSGAWGIALDKTGNVYTTNYADGSVTKISADGGSTAQFGNTFGRITTSLALDDAGNVYANGATLNAPPFAPGAVTKISADGATTAQFGADFGMVSQAYGIAVHNGAVFTGIDTIQAKKVMKISADGQTTSQFGGDLGGTPQGLAIDAAGNVFVSTSANKVMKISADGATTAQFGGDTGAGPRGIAVDSAGNVYTANFSANTVTRISADGQTTEQYGGSTGKGPWAIAIDADDNVYTANRLDNTVTKMSPVRGPLLYSSGSFGTVQVGATGKLTVTVTNSGKSPVRPTSIKAEGTGVSVTGGTCAAGAQIPAKGTCTVELSWAPTAAGALSGGTLMILYPDGAGTGEGTELTGTATAAPTPTPSSTTTLKVFSHKGPVKAGRKTVLTRKQRTDGEIKKVRARCELRGTLLPNREADRLCDVNIKRPLTAAVTGVRITAAPTCSKGLRIYATIVAKKAGAKRAVWNKAWRVTADPAIRCKISGTG